MAKNSVICSHDCFTLPGPGQNRSCKPLCFSPLFSLTLFLLSLSLLALALYVTRTSAPELTASGPVSSTFVPLTEYDLRAVNPSEVLSTLPRIREGRIVDLSPNCLKHPSNGVDNDCWNEFRRHQFLSTLDSLYDSPPAELKRFDPHEKWQIFDLITPTYLCDANSLRRIGADGDGGKWLCGPIRVTGPKCVVFSLGSNNQFDFEEAVHDYTKGQCEIHTFDCTGQWSNPRTSFHSWCLGGADEVDHTGRTFKRLSTVARELGVKSISLLKMDIEHAEYDVFESLKHEPEEFLPDQIMFELHTLTYPRTSKHKDPENWVKTIIDLVRDIDSLGYSFALQEKNLLCGGCSEFVIVRDRPSVINPRNMTSH